MCQDLFAAVRRHELGGLQKHMNMMSSLSILDILLNDEYQTNRPRPQDYESRWDLVRVFSDMTREIYGNDDTCPVVKEFGSFVMDMFNVESDLDLSINFSDKKLMDDRSVQMNTLRKFAKKCYVLQRRGHVKNIQPILSARVPVLKVTDCGTGIECDISVGNLDGIEKSQIVRMISAIDERFQKLSFLLKAWAKAHDINSSKDGTLNSISLILLAAFHLQTRNTPILPPFSAILKDGVDPEAVQKTVPTFYNYGISNKESLAELFVSLLVKLESVEELWSEGLCASTYNGSWIRKKWKANYGCISIEDFTDTSQNASRAVRLKLMEKIYSSIHRCLEYIRKFTEGNIDAVTLKILLFRGDNAATEVVTNVTHHAPSQPALPKQKQTKRKRRARKGPAETQRETRKLTNVKAQTHRQKGEPDRSLPNFQGTPSISGPVPLPTQGPGGSRLERFHMETLRHVTPSFSNYDPLNFPNPAFQSSWPGQPQPFTNLPIQGPGWYGHERAHIESFNYSNFQTPFPYSSPRTASVQPPHPPHLPFTPSMDPMWLGRSNDPHRTFHSDHPQFANGFHGPGFRGNPGNQLPQPLGYQSYIPFHNFE